MRDASVGFQCPECVKEGAKSTRQAKAAYGGQAAHRQPAGHHARPDRRSTCVVFLLIRSGGGRRARRARAAPARRSSPRLQQVEGVSGGACWQILTSVFAHAEVPHLGFNMLSLYFLGPMLEQARRAGPVPGDLPGLGGHRQRRRDAAERPQQPDPGCLGRDLRPAGRAARGGVQGGRRPAPDPVLAGARPRLLVHRASTVSWQGHLGGFVGGVLVAAIIVYAPRQRRELLQWSGIGAVVLVSVVLIVVRRACWPDPGLRPKLSPAVYNPVENYTRVTRGHDGVRRAGHSHLVANAKPRAMKATPRTRFFWPRLRISGIVVSVPTK